MMAQLLFILFIVTVTLCLVVTFNLVTNENKKKMHALAHVRDHITQ